MSMCELFGISSAASVNPGVLLRTFFSHSETHVDGWGLALFDGNAVNLEKEPVKATDSSYLKYRLRSLTCVRNMFAHIRKATRGCNDYENCHPFVMHDCDDRAWTLMHNGTIFRSPELEPFFHVQTGKTDSERILCYIVERVNVATILAGHSLSADERFRLLDEIICQISLYNKLNLIIYDGELFYVHTNYKNSLYTHQEMHTALFSTTPLDARSWLPLTFTTLLAYKDGRLVSTGTCHGHEYIDNPEDTQFLFFDYIES